MLKFLSAFFMVCVLLGYSNSAYSETQLKELPECIVKTHCFRVELETKEVENTFLKLSNEIANTPRTQIVEQTNLYIHAVAKTRWLKYIDDLLVQSLPNKGVVQIRSESRVGIGDNGVNKKRVEELTYRVMTNQSY